MNDGVYAHVQDLGFTVMVGGFVVLTEFNKQSLLPVALVVGAAMYTGARLGELHSTEAEP